MTDPVDKLRICLKVMGLKEFGKPSLGDAPLVSLRENGSEKIIEYNPVINAEQAMEMAERFRLNIIWHDGCKWLVRHPLNSNVYGLNVSMKQSIVNCVVDVENARQAVPNVGRGGTY